MTTATLTVLLAVGILASSHHASAAMTTPRTSLAAASIGPTVYLGGGYLKTGQATSLVEILDAETLTFSHSAHLSEARGRLTACSIHNTVFFAGGSGSNGASAAVDMFDGLIWNTTVLSQPRSNLAASAAGDLVLFAGGIASATVTDRVDVFDTVAKSWSTTTLSVARSRLAAASSGNRIWFAGGSLQSGVSNALDCYDTIARQWQPTGSLSVGRTDLGSAAFGSRVLFVGGHLGSGVSDRVDLYQQGEWTTHSLSAARSSLSAAGCGDAAFVAGGVDAHGNVLNRVDVLTASDGLSWSLSAPLDVGREGACSATAQLKSHSVCIVAGGATGSGSAASVDAIDLFWTTSPSHGGGDDGPAKQASLDPLDGVIVGVYLIVMLGINFFVGAYRQKNRADYYMGGRKLPWWAVGISQCATQLSAVSFVSIPSFVAMRGGLTWLQYELSVPLAMIFAMAFMVPYFRGLELVSVYEWVERRMGKPMRILTSAAFLLCRGLSSGVYVYMTAIILSVLTGISIPGGVLLVGGATVLFASIGGMNGVVWGDVIQMCVLLSGIVLIIVVSISKVGGLASVLDYFPVEKLVAIEPRSGMDPNDPQQFSLWAFLLGGMVLYVQYYALDQSQAQRYLSAKSIDDAKGSLMLNGLIRFPITCGYAALGVSLGALLYKDKDYADAVGHTHADRLVPVFIRDHVPIGAKGIIFAAILSSAQSSLAASVHSMSAAIMRDFFEDGPKWAQRLVGKADRGPIRPVVNTNEEVADLDVTDEPEREEEPLILNEAEVSVADEDEEPVDASVAVAKPWWRRIRVPRAVAISQLMTIIVGVFVTLSSFVVGGLQPTMVAAVNTLGSVFSGPILAVFLLGLFTQRATAWGVAAGMACGVIANVVAYATLTFVFWMWFNVLGLVVSLLVGYGVSRLVNRKSTVDQLNFSLRSRPRVVWEWRFTALAFYFAIILGVTIGLSVPFIVAK